MRFTQLSHVGWVFMVIWVILPGWMADYSIEAL